MKKNMVKKYAIIIAAPLILKAQAAVYITQDSMQPTSHQRLIQAQIQTEKSQTDAIIRSVESNEYMFAEMAKLTAEQRARNEQKAHDIAQQQVLLDKQRELNKSQHNSLYQKELDIIEKEKASTSRLLAYKVDLENHHLNERSALEKQRADLYRENVENQKAFSKKQVEAQGELLAMQQQVALSQDKLLEKQLRNSAPSNLIVVSKTAPNFKQEIKPTDAELAGEFSETKTEIPTVNMNEFISKVIPTGWEYMPPADFQNEKMSVVTGHDWKSIVNQIAVNHPYIEFRINPYDKTLTASTMNRASVHERSDLVRSWHLTTTRDLRGNLEYFGEQVDWDVLWDAGDINYPIVASATLRGSFSGINGVVNQLMKATYHEDFQYPLWADWNLGNKVVIIKRKGASSK